MSIFEICLVLHILFSISTGVFLYFEPSTRTVGDWLKNSWMVFIPFLNLLATFAALAILIGEFFDSLIDKHNLKERWEKLMDKQLKK